MSSKFIRVIITIQIVSCTAAAKNPVSGDQLSWKVMNTQTSRTNQKIAWTLKALVLSDYIISTNLSVAMSEKSCTRRTEEQNKIRMSNLQWGERVHSSSAWPCAVCEAFLLAAGVWLGQHGSCNQTRWLTAVEMARGILTAALCYSLCIHQILQLNWFLKYLVKLDLIK